VDCERAFGVQAGDGRPRKRVAFVWSICEGVRSDGEDALRWGGSKRNVRSGLGGLEEKARVDREVDGRRIN